MSRKRDYAALLTSLLLFTGQPAMAATSMLNISGNILLPPPCVINGTETISVDFTDQVMTTRVDGINYRQPVPYKLDCTGSSNNALKMKIQGMDAGFGGALQTTSTNLGIILSTDSKKMPVNSWLNFNLPDTPTLFATLDKRPGTTLKAEPFTATATMVVDYQ
ncbi:MAG: fimbrial protein [Enterobacterales bacterium]|uniref:fimbrial protein n=1 Tax=Serratia sp. (in: enterobacteria) TaxID=616 RepID=UPI003F35B35D